MSKELAEQWADIIMASLPSFATDDDFEYARNTITDYVTLIINEPGEVNGFLTGVGVEKEHCNEKPCHMGCFHCKECGMPDCGYHDPQCSYSKKSV